MKSKLPLISPIWLTSSAVTTLSSSLEEKRHLLRQPRDVPGVYLRNRVLNPSPDVMWEEGVKQCLVGGRDEILHRYHQDEGTEGRMKERHQKIS